MPLSQEQAVPFLTRAEIERQALDVLRSHGLESIPVDPVVLAQRLNIQVLNAKFSDDTIAGMITKQESKVTVLVNQGDQPYRKRFTIAHELGHHFLHLHENGELVDGEANLFRQARDEQKTTPDARREVQANIFAAALLMPADAIREQWTKLKSIEKLARHFNVSETSMGIRLDSLGLV